jgi:hypothetical protein
VASRLSGPDDRSVTGAGLSYNSAKRQAEPYLSRKSGRFFGRTRPYVGLDYLVGAFEAVAIKDRWYHPRFLRELNKEAAAYSQEFRQTLAHKQIDDQVIRQARCIGDEETEVHLEAPDISVLPYSEVFQCSVAVLSYTFCLAVIAMLMDLFAGTSRKGNVPFLPSLR